MSSSRVTLFAIALILVAPSALAEFGRESSAGWPVNVEGREILPPVDPHVHGAGSPPLNKPGMVTAYPYYPILTAEVQRLALEYPDVVKLSSAGRSVAGLEMWVLEIADFANPDMLPLEDREVIYIDGGTHSNEYSGVYFVTEVAQFLIEEYATNATAKWIVENRHTFILPLVNPDGSNAFGRLNARTVNINRNFPGSWGAVDESPIVNNPGPEAGSEPETQHIMDLMDKIRPDYVNSIHCCGNLWLHPWGAEQIPAAEDIAMFTRICDEVFYDVREDCGPIWSTIYPASGTTADEGYARVGASSWTYEMSGRGAVAPWGQPIIVDDVRVQERESWRGIMHALTDVDKYGAKPVITSLSGSATQLIATVENQGWGNLTAGNLSVNGVAIALPFLAPGEKASLTFNGTFAAGDVPVKMDWKKRIFMAPWETRLTTLALADDAGRLVAKLDLASVETTDAIGDDTVAPVPGFAPVFAGLALVGAALAMRRRS